jgi:Spy/CpxP family protein refolding chaperone
MKSTRTLIAGAVAGVALAVAAVTYAQPYGGGGHGFGPGMGMGPGHGAMANVDPAEMAETRLADLKAQLKINTSQEAAWQAFAAQAKAQAGGMRALRDQMQDGTGTAPERMAQRAAAMQQRADRMATMATAFGALYGVLTPEQKAIADQNVGMMGHRGKGFGRPAG